MTSELYYIMALTRVNGVGDATVRKLLLHFDSAEEVFRAKKSDFKNIDKVSNNVIDNILNFKKFDIVDTELKFIENNNVKIISVFDNEYPDLLKKCDDSPIILFTKGNISINNKKQISIVGTRNITQYGIYSTRKLLEELKVYNPVIISGYASGVDITAHLSSIENKMKTIAVLGHGLHYTYPSLHKKYNNLILENGAFVTEFWSSDTICRENFIKRNRIVAGMSEATIVIESAIKGGSLVTASIANDYDREVFAIPGRISDKYSEGCNHLIKTNQANLLTSVKDLEYMLNWDLEQKKKAPKVIQPELFEELTDNEKIVKKELKAIQPELLVELTGDEKIVYDYLKEKGKESLDFISIENNIPIHKLGIILLNLEMKNLITPLPGKLYTIN